MSKLETTEKIWGLLIMYLFIYLTNMNISPGSSILPKPRLNVKIIIKRPFPNNLYPELSSIIHSFIKWARDWGKNVEWHRQDPCIHRASFLVRKKAKYVNQYTRREFQVMISAVRGYSRVKWNAEGRSGAAWVRMIKERLSKRETFEKSQTGKSRGRGFLSGATRVKIPT